MPSMQVPLAHSGEIEQFVSGQAPQGPPQSMPCSAPLRRPSLQEGGLQVCPMQDPAAQSSLPTQ